MAGTRLIGFTPILYLFREIFSSIVAGYFICVGRGDVDESFEPHKSKEQLENVLKKNRELMYNQYKNLIDLILITKSNITFKIYDFESDDLEDVFTFLETCNG